MYRSANAAFNDVRECRMFGTGCQPFDDARIGAVKSNEDEPP
jgi:hypothetical protein